MSRRFKLSVIVCTCTALSIIACSGWSAAPPSAPALAKIGYSRGGPAPITSELTLFSDGQISLRSERSSELRWAKLRQRDLETIRAVVDSPRLREGLAQLQNRGEPSCCDKPEIVVVIGSAVAIYTPCEGIVPSGISDLITSANELGRRKFGTYLYRQMPTKCAAARTSPTVPGLKNPYRTTRGEVVPRGNASERLQIAARVAG
jgi:hypothetical protein